MIKKLIRAKSAILKKKIFLLFLKGFLCMGVQRTPIFWAEGYEDTSNFVTYPRKYNWRGNI